MPNFYFIYFHINFQANPQAIQFFSEDFVFSSSKMTRCASQNYQILILFFNKIKLKMSQYFQDPQEHENEFIAQCFLNNSEQQYVSPVETFWIYSEDQQERDSFYYYSSYNNQVPINDLIEENKLQNTQEKGAAQNFKRNSKTSKYNIQMGFISESPKPQKKTYKRKKIIYDPGHKPFQYPTKNFLQNFKGAHFQYIQKHFEPQKLQKIKLFGEIKNKNGISMQDYRDLYSVMQFEEVFEKMFRTKYLYRAMMLSRSEKKSRADHLRKLTVFEESFRTKVFKRIN